MVLAIFEDFNQVEEVFIFSVKPLDVHHGHLYLSNEHVFVVRVDLL